MIIIFIWKLNMNISVIVPSYNEADNLNLLLPKLHSLISQICRKYEIIVIDSRESTDNSEIICKYHKATYVVQKNKGYADAFRVGIKCATHEAILIVDADNSQDISKIPLMFDALQKGADVVIGSRYIKGGTTADPFILVAMSKTLNFIFRLLLGFKEKDISTDFRFYRSNLLKNIKTTCQNFDVIEETLFILKQKYPSLKTVEIPINYKPRTNGYSKRRLFRFILGYIRLIVKLRLKS